MHDTLNLSKSGLVAGSTRADGRRLSRSAKIKRGNGVKVIGDYGQSTKSSSRRVASTVTVVLLHGNAESMREKKRSFKWI